MEVVLTVKCISSRFPVKVGLFARVWNTLRIVHDETLVISTRWRDSKVAVLQR
jgi:hypothetical protein